MPKERLEQIRSALKRSSRTKSGDAKKDFQKMDELNHDSIGILNVNTRMTLYFGEEYSLLVDSEENVGTNIQLRIPYHTKDEGTSVLKPSPGRQMALDSDLSDLQTLFRDEV